MTTATNSFEGGTDGQLITAANSGGASGTAFADTSSYVYSTAQAAHGTQSAAGTGSSLFALGHVLTGTGTRWWRVYLRSDTTWGSNSVGALVGQSGPTYQVDLTTTAVVLKHYNGVDVVTLATINEAPAINQWIRVELQATSAAAAAGEIRLYNTADSVTPTGTASGARSQSAFSWESALYGDSFPSGSLWVDSVGWSDEGWLGPVVPPAAPRRVHAGSSPAVVRGATW